MNTVGIIGGLGPETTVEFYLKLLEEVKEKHVSVPPRIIIVSVPLPYELEKNAIRHNKKTEACLPFILDAVERLEKAGADLLVMPCNSLHIFIDRIREAANVPVLNIVQETVDFLKAQGIKKTGLMSTIVTRENALYEKALAENGIECFQPDKNGQDNLGCLIHDLVRGEKGEKQLEVFNDLVRSFESEDLHTLVLACTDLQLLASGQKNFQIFDSMEIFAKATAEYLV